MSWVRIDDQMFEHAKWVGRSKGAKALATEALCWANRYLSDGFIPAAIVRKLGYTPQEARELVHAKVWHACEGGGFLIHDYLAYQRSREEIETLRQVRAESGRQGGLTTAARSREQPLPFEQRPPSTLPSTPPSTSPSIPPSQSPSTAASNVPTNGSSNGLSNERTPSTQDPKIPRSQEDKERAPAADRIARSVSSWSTFGDQRAAAGDTPALLAQLRRKP